MNVKVLSVLLAVVTILAAAIGCTAAEPAEMTIATGGTAGTYYPIGQAMAQIITDFVDDAEATAVTSEGSVANAKSIGNKEAELALVENTIAYYAVQGVQMFAGEAVPDIRGIAALYQEIIQIVTLDDYGITSIGDLEGKSVGIGAPGSGTAVHMTAILKAAGLDKTNVDMQYLDFAECVEALKSGTIHAGCIVAGIPTAAVNDIAAVKDISIVTIPGEIYEALITSYPFYVPAWIPEDTYPGVDIAVGTIAVKAMLVTRADLSEDLVYEITKALFEHTDVIIAAHQRGNDIMVETALDGMPIALHPGAQKYFEEKKRAIP